ncbi:uncharacterized protein I206_105236 [Kwoniella pini CBS 10737]|uniref:Uncharacterized protein n=1 Tax=Kwoniella pini CBS 10737 TaxID=1296096 RepID=A0A1B9I4V1_9TREE|nr:uncharacterized protein I206_03855 [Kwoniella pini CBS 10737]OCF50530.1 hypothetical protein I206_03855 [Kwoniella pini CBS 10737]
MMIILRRDDDVLPPSPFSYFFPLLLIMTLCGGYIYWHRFRRNDRTRRILPLNFPTGTSPGIRLSEDGPPATVFTHDNASTDSLPSHALQEIPEIQQPSPIVYSDTNSTSLPLSSLPRSMPNKAAKVLGIGKSRRSNKVRIKSPIEGDDTDDEYQGGRSNTFDIGEQEDSGSDDETELHPMGTR